MTEPPGDDGPGRAHPAAGPGLLRQQLERLRGPFRERLRKDQQGFVAARDALSGGAPLDENALRRLTHSLHGVAATFGYEALSARAGELEALLHTRSTTQGASDTASLRSLLEALLAALDDALKPV